MESFKILVCEYAGKCLRDFVCLSPGDGGEYSFHKRMIVSTESYLDLEFCRAINTYTINGGEHKEFFSDFVKETGLNPIVYFMGLNEMEFYDVDLLKYLSKSFHLIITTAVLDDDRVNSFRKLSRESALKEIKSGRNNIALKGKYSTFELKFSNGINTASKYDTYREEISVERIKELATLDTVPFTLSGYKNSMMLCTRSNLELRDDECIEQARLAMIESALHILTEEDIQRYEILENELHKKDIIIAKLRQDLDKVKSEGDNKMKKLAALLVNL
jgi:pyruvate formate-lyase activating enzyme-like uncharacterized protein